MTLKEVITTLGKYCHSREDCDKCGCYAQEYGCVIGEFGINNYGDILEYIRDEPIEPNKGEILRKKEEVQMEAKERESK